MAYFRAGGSAIDVTIDGKDVDDDLHLKSMKSPVLLKIGIGLDYYMSYFEVIGNYLMFFDNSMSGSSTSCSANIELHKMNLTTLEDTKIVLQAKTASTRQIILTPNYENNLLFVYIYENSTLNILKVDIITNAVTSLSIPSGMTSNNTKYGHCSFNDLLFVSNGLLLYVYNIKKNTWTTLNMKEKSGVTSASFMYILPNRSNNSLLINLNAKNIINYYIDTDTVEFVVTEQSYTLIGELFGNRGVTNSIITKDNIIYFDYFTSLSSRDYTKRYVVALDLVKDIDKLKSSYSSFKPNKEDIYLDYNVISTYGVNGSLGLLNDELCNFFYSTNIMSSSNDTGATRLYQWYKFIESYRV